MSKEKLSKEELRRYSRHLTLPEVGKEGQLKLKKAKVLIIGAGGLGCPAALYLTAAGAGTIGIVDFDVVEESNLQRQILFSNEDIGKPKTTIIKRQLEKINNNIKIITHNEKLTSKNALEIIKNYDIIIDGSDNFPTRYLVNDSCVISGKPLVYGSVYRFDGQASVFNYDNGPCYRCLFPNPPPRDTIPSCAEAGVLGVLPGVIGTIQATEALKIILSGKQQLIKDELSCSHLPSYNPTILSGRYLVYNALSMEFKELKLNKNKNCPVCGENPTIKELIDYEQFCNGKKEENKEEVTIQELKKMIGNKEDFALIDVREKLEWDLGRIEGAELVPLSQVKNNNLNILKNLGKSKKIVLYCNAGGRSTEAINILKSKGYKNLKNLVGGITEWAKDTDNKIAAH